MARSEGTITTEVKAPEGDLTAAEAAPQVTRRNFVVWYLGGLLAAIGAAVVAPILVYIYPPAGKTQKKNLAVPLQTPLDQIKEGHGVSFDAPNQSGFVMADGGGDNYPGKIGFKGFVVNVGGQLIVLSATCSHLGCMINLNTSGPAGFSCPCHGSQFSLSGSVTHGPAVAHLSHYTWQKTSNPSQIEVLGLSLPGI